MIQQNHHRLVALNTQQETIIIDLEKWSLLGMGQGHIILKNNDPSDALYFKIHSAPQQIQSLYFQIINNIPKINNHLLKRQLITFDEEFRTKIKIFVSDELKISHKLPQNFTIFLAQNLNKSNDGWQYTLQFKPKTPLPDKYSKLFFDQFCQKLQINPNQIQFILNNRPSQQKTRWFKKGSLKINKKNMNPLQIFRVLTNKAPFIIDKIKKMDTFTEDKGLQNINQQTLNENILKQIVKSQILSTILAVQLLYVGPSDSVQTQFSLWHKFIDKQALITSINENVNKNLEQQLNQNPIARLQKIISQSIIFQGTNYKQERDRIQQMFRFLVSWSWRDVSLFIQIKLNNQQTAVQDIHFTIIDYQLKQTSKLAKTIQKDQQFLKYYLQYLQIIP